MTIRALDMIESPLLNEQGDAWLRNSVLSKDYIELLKMQDLSQRVIEDTSSWSTCFDRLIDTKDKACLDLLWKTINEVRTSHCRVYRYVDVRNSVVSQGILQ